MKGKRLIAFLLAMLLLAGCNGDNGKVQETTAATSATLELPTQETTEPTIPQITLEAVNALSSRASSASPDICVLDERTVALLTGGYESNDFSSYQTEVTLLDLYTDTVTKEITLKGEYTLVSAYGDVIALGCEKEGQILLLDRDLQQVCALEAKDVGGILTSDTTYYYVWGSNLYCVNVASGEERQVSPEQGLPLVEILDYDPETNTLMCTAFVNPYTVGTCTAAIDLSEETFVLLKSGFAAGGLTDSGIYLQGESETLSADISYGVWKEDSLYTVEDFLINNNRYSTWHVPGTDYLYRLNYDKAQNDAVTKAELYRMGQVLEVCQLPEPLDTVKAKQVIALPDGNLLVLAVNRRSYQLYLICPDELTFAPAATPKTDTLVFVDETVFEDYRQASVTEEVGEQLQAVRLAADAMEETYGVTILMSNQCAAAAQSSGKTITTTDKASLQDEAAWIGAALEDLEEAFSLYPEGFFRQFQNEAQERGVLILLVEDIADDLDVIGICYTMGDWSIVAVDITSGEVLQTYCHEFWHATEFKMMQENPLVFGEEIWNPCNPEGFSYSYDTTPGYINDLENTLFNNERDKNIYFIDPYAKTNAYEDRARLMEFVMYSDYYAARIATIPGLRNKLAIMAEAVREIFDTTGWDTPHWERFF